MLPPCRPNPNPNPIEQVFAKMRQRRAAAARPPDRFIERTAVRPDAFTAAECANHFADPGCACR